MRIVIIGGVAAGMSAAAKARRLDPEAEIVIYEKTNILSWGACGLPYFVGGFFDNPENMIARPVQKFIDSGMDVRIYHQVERVDLQAKTLEVKNLETGELIKDRYDKLMIATGADAIIPPIKHIKSEGVYLLKSFEDGQRLKDAMGKDDCQNIVVIGAGYIGLEVVEAAKHLGKKSVRIIQLTDRILTESFDAEITDLLEAELVSHDQVSLHVSEMVQEILLEDSGSRGSCGSREASGVSRVCGVKTDKGQYEADLVVLAVGVRPNTQFLAESGLEMLANGALVVNEHGQTNIADVYAAGDCASVHHLVREQDVYIPLATTANKLGRVVGENLAGLETSLVGTLGSAAIKVLDMEAARTGITEAEAKTLGLNYATTFIKDKNQTNYYPGQTEIYLKLIYDKESKKLLGAQMAGKTGAVLRVDALAVAIYAGLTVKELGMMDFCYAPPFARTWDVMNVAGNVAK